MDYEQAPIVSVIVTQSKVWKPDDFEDKTVIETIKSLILSYGHSDESARRFDVLNCWEARHFDRGWQYLLEGRDGTWSVAGATNNRTNGIKDCDEAGLFPTNIYSAQGDIITSALCRGQIKVGFTPVRSKSPEDNAWADAANAYKYIWEEFNDSAQLQRQLVGLAWTDQRAILWTRSIADPKNGVTDEGEVLVTEITTTHGVLETKLPMLADKLEDCGYAQIFEEMDYALARATFPWMGKKIKPNSGTDGELEFERIARINTRIGLTGNKLLGTSGIRETTIGYTWNRPGVYFDDAVEKKHRDFLIENFPSGLFVIMAGDEFVACWDESMDDHLVLGMFTRGFGQSRRALGTSDIAIQKRLNLFAELNDKFIRGSIGMVVLEDQAFNTEDINKLEASTTRFLPVAIPEGASVEQLMGLTPTPQPVESLFPSMQWYASTLPQSIDGATPALFGGGEGQDNTVGATQIRFQQALERIGTPWLVANSMFAAAVSQAVKCCAENGNAERYASKDGVNLSVDPRVLRSNSTAKCKCIAETLTVIPESGAQREAKVLQILNMAAQDPAVAQLIATSSNAREVVRALRIDDVFTINEADAEDGALEDIDYLLQSEPLLNPQWQQLSEQVQQMTQDHEQAKQQATVLAQSGGVDPQIIQKGQQMEQQLEQLQQQLQQMPQYLPSVEVPQDDSVDHATIASTVFAWMQASEGRRLRRQAAQESPENQPEYKQAWNKWTNVFLYWKAHNDLAKNNAKGQPPAPKVSLSGKLAPDTITQLLLAAGVNINPQTPPEPQEQETETIQRGPYSEVKQRTRKKL